MNTNKDQIQKIIASEYARGSTPHRTLSVPSAGNHKNLIVVKVPTSLLTLNKDNHRINSQITDAQKIGTISKNLDFKSEAGQLIVSKFLSETPEFNRIKQELKDQRQKEPALISINGLLSDGNTRCVALKKLEEEGQIWASQMDVAVIEDELTQEQLLEIEIELQLVENKKQKYSFTNRLIMYKGMHDRGMSYKEIAKRIGKPRSGKTIEKELALYSIIKEIRNMSPDGVWIQGEVFDEWSTVLGDIYDEYQKLKKTNIQKAENLKYNKILAMFLGLSKDQVRNIDEDTFTHNLEDFEEDPDAKGALKLIKKCIVEGDEVFGGSDELQVDGAALLQGFLKQEDLFNKANGHLNRSNISKNFDIIASKLNAEADRITKIKRAKTRGEELSLTLQNIKKDLRDLREILPERMRDKDNFSEGYFTNEIKNCMKELEGLEKIFNKYKLK